MINNQQLYYSIINDIAKIVKQNINESYIPKYSSYNSLLTEKQRIQILKTYGIYDLLYNLNEEISLDNTEDLEHIKLHFGKLKEIIPDLIYRLVKVGAKSSVKQIIKVVKFLIKKGKSNKDIVKYIFGSLLFFVIGFTGNTYFNDYNNDPIIDNTELKYEQIDGEETLIISGENQNIVITQPDKDKAPQVKTIDKKLNKIQPIKLLTAADTKSDYYKASPEIAEALKEVEKYVSHIYDAKKPSRKITKKDMLNMSYDLTIGYGHKLTKEERRAWSYDKTISKAEASKLFMKDLSVVEKQVNGKLKTLAFNNDVEYSQGFIDGLISLNYNMGYGNMFGNNTKKPCEFWQRLNKCKIDDINGCINKQDIEYTLSKVNTQNVTEKGHVYRRRAEYKIMSQKFGSVNPELYHLLAPEFRNS